LLRDRSRDGRHTETVELIEQASAVGSEPHDKRSRPVQAGMTRRATATGDNIEFDIAILSYRSD
jgi:hypothetical protein